MLLLHVIYSVVSTTGKLIEMKTLSNACTCKSMRLEAKECTKNLMIKKKMSEKIKNFYSCDPLVKCM